MWKKILEKIKAGLIKLWGWFTSWIVKTVWPWFKTDWMEAVNMFVIWVAFLSTKGFLHIFVGSWFFIMVVYFVFWKLLGISKLFKKVAPINPPTPPAPTV